MIIQFCDQKLKTDTQISYYFLIIEKNIQINKPLKFRVPHQVH